ncbi:MFS general substrate transporter [Mycena venus]|uniref:MFS general substrate transporter n=1 Tax=Mycena venus TaxID=2733690 RepID=A0A8H7CRT4_9AGAR|nr:MFS general substrate transporter [Mycena venus]
MGWIKPFPRAASRHGPLSLERRSTRCRSPQLQVNLISLLPTSRFLMQFCGFGYTTSFGVYQDFYVRDYLSQSSSSAISSVSTPIDFSRLTVPSSDSWIGSINALLGVALSLVSGPLYDRGHFRLVVYSGCFIQSFSLFMLSLCQRQHLYQILLAQGVLAGLGLGIAYVPSVAVVSHYFRRRRGLVMALVQSGTPLGAIVHPILLNNTLHNSQIGFGNAVRISAGINSAILLLACILVRPRLPPLQSVQHRKSTQIRLFLAAMQRVCRDRAYVLATIGMTAFVIAFWYPIFFLQLDAVTHGVGRTFAFYVLVIMNASGLAGRIVSGFLAEIFGVANVVTAAAGCGTALVLGIILLRTIASVVVLAVLNGFVAGVYAALLPPLLVSLTEDFAEVGLRMGLSFTIEGFGGLIGPPICGALLTTRFVWWRPALFSGGMGLLGFVLFLAAVFIVRRKESKGTRGRTSWALGTAEL